MINSPAYKEELKPKLESITQGNPNTTRYTFSKATIKAFQGVLNHYSTNNLMDTEWSVVIVSSRRSFVLKFPSGMSDTDGIILRALVLDYLLYCGSLASCKRIIHDATIFFSFLKDHKFFIENCRSSIINLYVSYLDSRLELSTNQKNSLMRTVSALMDVCSTYGLLHGTGFIDCSHRWKEHKMQKRAPDSCVITALDTLFFDINNSTIPSGYRCIYFILRLIVNRINEVLTMDIECLTYPDIDVYAISIPTTKETPLHKPIYKSYNRKLSGWCEGLLHESIYKQKTFAQQKQSELDDIDQGYLFVSPSHQRIITIDEFNNFLEHICISNKILDASGNQAHITSHDFRHTAIGERLRGNIISPIQTMIESNHSSLKQTMGYGYQSQRDEAIHLGSITSKVLQASLGISPLEEDKVEPIIFPTHKYRSIENQPFTRLIPGYGICCVVSCFPRYELCFKCSHFTPDNVYFEYFENAIIILEEKITMLQKKNGSEDAIKFNKEQLELFHQFIRIINTRSMKIIS